MAAITVAALALRAPRLGFPPEKYFDEVYYVDAAQAYLNGFPDPNSVHPPLGKLTIAAGIWLSRWAGQLSGVELSEPFGWRLAALLFGVAMIPIVYWMGFRVSQGSTMVAVSASALVAADFVHLVQSRIAMLDPFMAFWSLAGAALALKFILDRPSLHLATLAGLAFGAATACKWSGLFAAAGACAAMIVIPSGQSRRLRGYLPVIFALTIGLVFLASYTPHFLREGFDLEAVRAIENQGERMVSFRYDENQFTHRYKSEFWQWPLVLKPVWYHYQTTEAGLVSGIVCLGSVIFWWTSLCFMAESAYLAATTRDGVRAFLVLNYLANWFPWIISTTGGFIYYMLPGVPFMALATSLSLRDWCRTPAGVRTTVIYLGLIAVALVLTYPFLVGIEVPRRMFEMLFFAPGWV